MKSRTAILLAVALSASALSSPIASADVGPGSSDHTETDTHTDADFDSGDGTVSALAGGVRFDTSKNGSGSESGQPAPTGNWAPPACWYAPKWTPTQFKIYVENIWAGDSTGYQWDAEQRKRYEGGEPYTDFNMKKSGKGYWWDSFVAEGRAADPGADDCGKPYFWVDKGSAPPADAKNAVSPKILAQLAYSELRVPDTKVTLSPSLEAKQTVNLPTWAWLDKTAFKPVSVTASVDALNISATTTATPVSLRLDPGTEDAELHPASGECPIEDGRIGTPYTKGQGDRTPPCGLTYLRASQDGPFPFKATLTWKISWEGSDGRGGDLPDGTFGTTTEVTVQEAQAVNR